MASLGKANAKTNSTSPVQEWIRERFMKRECVRVVPVSKDSSKCGCGRHLALHYFFESEEDSADAGDNNANQSYGWNCERCTVAHPTDAHGTLTFRVGKGSRKARYVRADFEADPADLWRLLVEVWDLEPPTLVITIQDSGDDQSTLSPSFIKAFKRGLAKASRTASTWIITSGLKTGITEHVTSAFNDNSSWRNNKSKRVHVIGFAPWGLVRGAEQLLINANDVDVPYYGQLHQLFHNESNHRQHQTGRLLAEGHSGFVLIDDGTLGRSSTSAQTVRRRFEDFLRCIPLKNANGRCVPMVCLMVNGKLNAIEALFDYVSTDPPAPVVVCGGTGGAADWVSSIYERPTEEDREEATIVQRRVVRQIQTSLGFEKSESMRLASILSSAVNSKKNFITVYRVFDPDRAPVTDSSRDGGRPEENELDVAMLNALLKGLPLASTEKLNLTVTWDREDLAREILEEAGGVGLEWPNGSLDEAMMHALMYDRVDFVNLLLSNGINMDRFLTIARLEQLYNSESGPPNTLRFILRDVVKNVDANYKYKLSHVGLIIEKLMGFGYRSTYCRSEFRKRYKMELQPSVRRKSTLANVEPIYSIDNKRPSIFVPYRNRPHFAYPYHELFTWAVLTNRKHLAMCFWQNGQEQLAKALFGSRLYQSLAKEAEEDYLEMDVCQQLQANANEFKTLAYDLVCVAYETDDDLTLQLLTYELRQFGKLTCIYLAAISNNETLVAHQSCQLLLSDLWLGGLRLRKNVNLKILAGILFPPLVATLTFKSKEELLLQAQTAEESENYRSDDRKKSWQDDSSSISSESENESEPTEDVEGMNFAEESSHEPTPNFHEVRRQSHFVTGETSLPSNSLGHTVTFSPSVEEKFKGEDRPNQRKHSDQLSLDEAFPATSTNRRKESHNNTTSFSQMDLMQDGSFVEKMPKPFKRFATAVELLDTGRLGRQMLDKPPTIAANIPRQRQQLEISRKILEFYSAPVTAFWSFTIGYAVFLSFFTYIVLVKTPLVPQWPEYYVIAFFATFSADQIRKVLLQEPRRFSAKLRVFVSSIWDTCTTLACISFFFALVLRLDPDTVAEGRVLYSINIVFWYLRVLRLLSVNASLSPYINMYGKMVVQLFLLSTILFIIMVSFGILRQSITYPDEEWQWALVRGICYKPYSMLYGSLYPEEISECEDTGKNCTPGFWLTPIFMTLYLLLAIVVFMNMMVAAFSHIFNQVNSRAQEIAKFEGYHQVVEFEQQPFLPPPLIIFAHVYMIGKYLYRRFFRKDKNYRFEHSLKLFLTPEEKEKLREFERDCVTELLAKKADKEANSLDARLLYFSERLDAMTSQVDYLHEQDQSHRLSLFKFEKLLFANNNGSQSETDLSTVLAGNSSSGALGTPMRSISDSDATLKKPETVATISPHFANGHANSVQKIKPPRTPTEARVRLTSSESFRVSSDDDMRSRSGSAPTTPSWKRLGVKHSPAKK